MTTKTRMTDIELVRYAKSHPVTLWQGISELTGEWTRAIGAKTGNSKTGKGYGVSFYTSTFGAGCGSCAEHCYVLADGRHAKIHRDRIADDHPVLPRRLWPKVFGGQYVRLGIFGDGGTIPFHVLQEMIRYASNWTGYSHLWRELDVETYGSILQASLDHPDEIPEADAKGWQYFLPVTCGKLADHKQRPLQVAKTIRQYLESIGSDAIVCPHFTSQGRVQCNGCKAECKGTSGRFSIVIPTHGVRTAKARTVSLPVID